MQWQGRERDLPIALQARAEEVRTARAIAVVGGVSFMGGTAMRGMGCGVVVAE